MSDEAMKVEVRADFAQFEKALLKLQNQTDAGLNRVEKKFSKSNANLRKETSQLGSVFDGLGKSIGGAGGGLPGLGGGVGALGIAGAAAAIGVGALVASLRGLKDAAKFAADLTDSADRIGVTVEALQELRYAADETGVPLASLDSGLESLNATLGAFKTGIGAARITPVFKALGLTREDLVGVENARDLLPVLADRLGQVGDRAAQVQLAKKLGIESLLPLLRQGSDGLNRMASEGRDLGLVLSNEVVSGLDETDRALEKNQQQIDANVRSMQANLAPFFLWCSDWLAKLSRGFTDLLDRGKRIEERNDRNLASRSTQLEEPVRRAYEMSNRRGRPIMPWQQRLIDEKARVDAEIAQRARERIATSGPSAADRTREGGYDLNLPAERSSGSGGGGGARGNNDAARAAETALRRQRRLDDDLAAASTATLQAQSQLATSAEQRASIAIQLLDSERQQRQVQLDRLVTDGEITAADKARLTAAEAGLYTAREANIAAELQRSIIERQGQAESDLLGITRDMLVTRSGNAATAAERLATDKAILELHQRERRSALERALLAEGITDVERQTLQAMIAKLDELEPAETRSLEDSASRGVQTARGFVAEGQERRDLPA
ncbi:MAG: hypothetical protein ACRED4_02050, partial [Brevundimonas sp.]